MTGDSREGSYWGRLVAGMPEAGRVDRVRDDLYISGFPGALTVEHEAGWHIVTVAEELVDEIQSHTKQPLRFPGSWDDSPNIVNANLVALANIKSVYERERTAGNKVLIHCAAGVERSATAVCYILSDGDASINAMADAHRQLLTSRPEVILGSIIELTNWDGPQR